MVRAFSELLEGKEYMEIRNALTVLTKIVKVFPAIKIHGTKLLEKATKLMEEEEREDLKVLASRYHALLDAQLKTMVTEEVFLRTPEKIDKSKTDKVEKKFKVRNRKED